MLLGYLQELIATIELFHLVLASPVNKQHKSFVRSLRLFYKLVVALILS